MPAGRVLTRGRLERVTDYQAAIGEIDTAGAPLDAVAFKAVHGGPDYCGTFVVDAAVEEAMERFLPAAPAHNAIYLAAIRAFRRAMPGVPLIAAFETEFHASMPARAYRYGVPPRWYEDHGVRKYGFHGASHRFIAERAQEFLQVSRSPFRLVSCHLGGSSSMAAIVDGRSVDTTMGFSPQSGLENAARHGDLDVFSVLYVMDREGWSTGEVRTQLAKNGGLAGISGIAGGDVRDLEEAAAKGNGDAALALDVLAYEVRKSLGAYAAAMGGIDAIAFTGGIGENSASIRAACLSGLEFLGVKLDDSANTRGKGDREISPPDSPVTVVVLATNEELIVARRAYRLLAS